MANILYIKATPKAVEESWTLKMAEFFLQHYQQQHPEDIVTILDLYQQQPGFLTLQDLHDMMLDEKGVFAKEVDQFLAQDKYIIAAPFWNHSVPAILRAYIDRIITVNKTFYYDEILGPQPLVTGKKAMFFMGRGGFYSQGPAQELEFGVRYWQSIASEFLGLQTTYHVLEGTAVLPLEQVEQMLHEKQQQLVLEAQHF